MNRILCCSCSKRIKTPIRSLRVCKGCGKPVCFGCQLDGLCKECGIVLYQNVIARDYYEEKYKTEKTKLSPFCEL